MKDTIKAKIIGDGELEDLLPKGCDQKEIFFSGIGDIVDFSKKPLENGEYLITYKIKTRLITELKLGDDKIEIKPQKGSWSQNKRNEIISFWKNEIRDKTEKTHQDIYNNFCKWVDNKMGEFYQEEIKRI
jgi:hypothetical protein